MARALGAMGATGDAVDYPAFARDLEAFFSRLESVQADLLVAAGGGGGLSAGLETETGALALELTRIGEAHDVRFPPDFSLLLKQSLYFDRWGGRRRGLRSETPRLPCASPLGRVLAGCGARPLWCGAAGTAPLGSRRRYGTARHCPPPAAWLASKRLAAPNPGWEANAGAHTRYAPPALLPLLP
jgi:hypothetical protein